MKNQKGYTILEVIIALAFIISVALCGGAIYVAWHFIAKMW